MTPRDYEMLVCDYYVNNGYITELTPPSNDWGIDVFAEKNGEKLAIQVKKFGGTTRKINREEMMKLHGAKDFFDCSGAVLATDGIIMEDAIQVANKLGIKILYLNQELYEAIAKQVPELADNADTVEPNLIFEQIWEKHIMPLQGKILQRKDGKQNTITKVDWSGLERITSNGRKQFIKIEIFKQTINYLLTIGHITRDEINQQYALRASSGIVLILAQVPFFIKTDNPTGLEFRKLAEGSKNER